MNRRILVVDDEPDLVTTVKLILETEGDQALEASTGEEAVRLLGEEDPDAVLLDIRLPGELDGWGVLKFLRETGRLEETPVVMVSAHATPSTTERALREGCSAYITKPFRVDELLGALDAAAGAGG